MELVMYVVSIIGWKASGIDLTILYFYICFFKDMYKFVQHITNDKSAKQ